MAPSKQTFAAMQKTVSVGSKCEFAALRSNGCFRICHHSLNTLLLAAEAICENDNCRMCG